MLRLLLRWFTPSDAMSASWLKAQERTEDRTGYEGVSIRFPIRKMANEAAPFNTKRLKRRA